MICNTCCSKRSFEKHNAKMCQKKQFKIICGNNRSCKYKRINESEPKQNYKEESAEKINSHVIISSESIREAFQTKKQGIFGLGPKWK